MISDRKPSLILSVAGMALLLFLLYGGAYYAIVETSFPFHRAMGPYPIDLKRIPLYWIGDISNPWWWDSELRNPNPQLQLFFSPIHALDRRVRPHVWEPSP